MDITIENGETPIIAIDFNAKFLLHILCQNTKHILLGPEYSDI